MSSGSWQSGLKKATTTFAKASIRRLAVTQELPLQSLRSGTPSLTFRGVEPKESAMDKERETMTFCLHLSAFGCQQCKEFVGKIEMRMKKYEELLSKAQDRCDRLLEKLESKGR
jgi:hypothetical protein